MAAPEFQRECKEMAAIVGQQSLGNAGTALGVVQQ
jgi:hypothetical protein